LSNLLFSAELYFQIMVFTSWLHMLIVNIGILDSILGRKDCLWQDSIFSKVNTPYF